VRRVEEVLQRPNEIDRGTPDMGWTANGAIELRHASLRHSGRSHALEDVSLSIEPGEVVAFVGETGSGKTSVANLVCGFYDPDSGDVLIDGRSHADVTHADWRRQVAAVFQDSGLLQRSVRDNVAMLQDVPDDVVLRSLEVTDADAFVRRLRHGIQSQVSLGGDNFSAGQGQRLALARAVVRDAPILVLDEATCNLDSHTERKVMDSILEQRRGKTTLLFGHRLSALDRASRVVVLAGGRIVETGTLDELVARNGEFVRLFEAQLAQRRRPRRLPAALPPPSASDDVA
jgi:ABC-type multidrug transport system fused ATPase/permease subunit